MNWCHLPRRSCALDFKEPHASWVYTFQEIQKHFGHYFFKCTFFTPFHFSGGLKSCVYYAALIIYLIIHFIWDSFHSCVFIQLNIHLTITGVTFTWFFPSSLWFAFSCLWVYLVIFFLIGWQKIFLTLTCWMVAILYLCKYSSILFLAISYLEFFWKFRDLFFRSPKREKLMMQKSKWKEGQF